MIATRAVASWKTDQLGFEVSGRVEFVVEPETSISGGVSGGEGGGEGGDSARGTELARLDPTRYELNLESAKAEVLTAERQREAAQIELNSVIPAQQEAAQAQFVLATTELERNQRLVADNAAPARAVDISKAKLDESQANLRQLEATREAKRAEVASIDAKIARLQDSMRQAERDLADCHLFWSVPGQVADVHVIAGSYVERGEPVVTVQMMQPIKVEFEVAASTARTLNHRDQVTIYDPQPDGTVHKQLGFIYMIDPVADLNTRTFTITLLLPNTKVRREIPQADQGKVFARTDTIGKLFMGFGSKPNSLFVSEVNLQQDEEGHFIWKIVDQGEGTLPHASRRLFTVKKIRVAPGKMRFPLLGLVALRDVQIVDGEEFDPAVDMITGKIIPPPDAEQGWSGGQVFYDVERWELRPGDLVSVDLRGGETRPGFYVPLSAIMEKSGTNFVLVVGSEGDGNTVRRVDVTVHDPIGTLRRIEAVTAGQLSEGMKIVAAGAVFFVDGRRVDVAEEVEVRR